MCRHIRRHTWGIGALVTIVTLATQIGCRNNRDSVDEIRIGLLADLPTPGGQPTVNAAQLSIAEYNAAGGVTVAGRRYRLKLIVRDTDNNPTTAMEVARELIYQQHVRVLIGPNISRNAIPVARIAEQAQVPMLSPGSTHPDTTTGKRFAFRVALVDAVQGEVMADFAIDHLRAQRAALLYDVANPSTKGVSEVFMRVFAERGGEIVSTQTYVTGERDFEARIQALREVRADVLFLPNRSADVAIQAERVRALGIDSLLLGSDAWSPHKLQSVKALEGAYFGHHWHVSMRENDEQNRQFVDRYEQRFGEPPAVMSALTYDAIGILVRAMSNSASVEPKVLRDSLAAAHPYDGITGRSVFRGSGNPFKNAVILHYRQGRALFFDTVQRVARAD